MANLSLLSLSLTFLLLFHGRLATKPLQQQHQQNHCQISRINALQPNERVNAEGGYTEFFDANNKQFQCAGVEVIRHTIRPQGLLLPSYINTPIILYVLEGSGIQGVMMPGCAETFQSSQQFQERHQKIENFQRGDVVVFPAGAPHWIYNNGQEDVVLVALLDSTNSANQLDQFHRRFFLAGKPHEPEQQQQQQGRSWGRSQKGESQEEASGNIFKGFDVDILAEAFNVNEETAESLQSKDDTRGHIVMVERGLQVIKPPTIHKQEQQGGRGGNGFEETVCSPKIRANINNPSSADFFNPQAGWSINLNSFKLPILGMVQLSAERGVLHRNAMMSPHWMMNAHNIIYVTHGSMWMQIVNNEGESVFNDEIQEGELVVVPQNFPVVKQAKEEGCRWISFRTNDNAMINKLAGHTSALRAMPVDVIANAFQMSPEQAWSVKNNRKESVMFSPSSRLSRRSVDHA